MYGVKGRQGVKGSGVRVSTFQWLAKSMATQARRLRSAVAAMVVQEEHMGPWQARYKTYGEQTGLYLSIDEFSDLQAQTIVYGLFAARCLQGSRPPAQQSIAAAARLFLPPDISCTITDALNDQQLGKIVNDLMSLLKQLHLESSFADFPHGHDYVMYFYEHFLCAYDPKSRQHRGVYYTPQSIVSYIVKSIDELLRRHCGLAAGLAEPLSSNQAQPLLILDPAAGTGTFLRSVATQIRATVSREYPLESWSNYVHQQLLPRLFGLELLLAPYAISHLTMALELGSALAGDGWPKCQLQVANALAAPHPGVLAQTTNVVPEERPLLVVLGNPPYCGHSVNQGAWIHQLLRGQSQAGPTHSYFHMNGEPLGEKNSKWLNDDYVKFIRFAQWHIEQAGAGIVGFVTNHSYLTSPTFRAMRCSLLQSFDTIYVLDLHGNSKRGERTPNGERDVNVFNIQQGVAIGLFVKSKPENTEPSRVFHAELWGGPQSLCHGGKDHWLAHHTAMTTPWETLTPMAPHYLLVPEKDSTAEDYGTGWPLPEIFPRHGVGMVTTHDALAISWTPEESMAKVSQLLATPSEAAARQRWRLRSHSQWNYGRAKRELADGSWREHTTSVLYRPFDLRCTIVDRNIVVHPRQQTMGHMLAGPNLALCVGRAGQATGSPEWDVAFVSRYPTDLNLFRRGGNCVFPLYTYTTSAAASPGGCQANLAPEFIQASQRALGLTFLPHGSGNLTSNFGPDDVLHSIYALLWSKSYRSRHGHRLKVDFPRLPLIHSPSLFADLVHWGQRLTALHLLQDQEDHGPCGPWFRGQGPSVVEVIRYHPADSPHAGQVWINGRQRFTGIRPDTWAFTIGGYRPAQKWLKDRKGRTLFQQDINHYRRLCVALAATPQCIAAIDQTITHHGGWPL